MRVEWSVAFACALLAAAASARAQQQPLPPPPAPPSQMPAALSVPNPFAGTHPGPIDLYRSPDGSDRFRLDTQYPPPAPTLIGPGGYLPGPYFVPTYYSAYPYMPLGYATPVRPPVLRGRLTLETIPEQAQVYVDGFYVGLAEEFGLRGRPLELSAGSHHIELRSPEHETLSFSVMITADDTIRYRGEMRRLAVAPAAVAPLARRPQSTSVYVISKCYAGDKPPAHPLPAGCDRSKLQPRRHEGTK